MEEKTKDELFIEFENHLMNDLKPSEYFNRWVEGDTIKKFPIYLLAELKNVPQSPKHHPEGSVWNHTMMVVDNASKRKSESEDVRAFMWAALLHDIGKAPTTRIRKDKITSYNHDKVGETLSVKFLKEWIKDDKFVNKVAMLVKWHMQPLFVVGNMPFANIGKMTEEISVDEIALLSMCDRLGRGQMTADKIEKEKNNIALFVKRCKKQL